MGKLKLFIQQMKEGGNPLDIIWCGMMYGASPNNYREFGFSRLTAVQRKTYVTNRLSRKMIKRFNDPDYINIFEDKTQFAERFEKYFGRKWISSTELTKEKLDSFINAIGGKFIYKPAGEAQGQGIKVFENVEAESVWNEIKDKPKAILEEWITQHEELNKIYSDAINCIRIITVFKDGKNHFLTGGITWGNGKKIANASASGIVSPVNFETGLLEKPAADFYGHSYTKHPITGENVIGIKLPYWKETLAMLDKAAAEIPQVGYIGWDVAITPSGPIIIEGNTTPGYKYYQIPKHMTNKTGNKSIYQQFL